MGVSGQRHAPAALLPPGKGPPVPIGIEVLRRCFNQIKIERSDKDEKSWVIVWSVKDRQQKEQKWFPTDHRPGVRLTAFHCAQTA
jgi:hypothetical protein